MTQLSTSNWNYIRAQQIEIALLPWGATEPHNYHLPYGTDNLLAEKISEMAVNKANSVKPIAIVLPTIPLGVQNPGQIELPFCLHIRPSVQILILREIISSLQIQGIKKLILMNGHGGNDFKTIIRELQPEFPDFFLCTINYWSIVTENKIFDEPGDHAGELETSLMMYFYPQFVNLSEAGKGFAKDFKLKGLKNKIAWTPRNWSKVTEDTGVGNPEKSTALKGKLFAENVTDKIADFIIELSENQVGDIYEKNPE